MQRTKKNSSPSRRLKIIRVVLHSEHRKMDRAALKGEGFWKHLKRAYGSHLPDYQDRISALIAAIKNEDPDIVLFPACTAIWSYHAQLERYRREIRKLPYVIFGALRIGQQRLREHSEIWAAGKRLARFDARWPIAIQLAGQAAVVAQSSTIKVVYQAPYLVLPSKTAPSKPPYRLALTEGHGQYSFRFARSLRVLHRMGPAVVLSFWRNKSGTTNYRWVESSFSKITRREMAYGDYLDEIVV